MWISCRWLARHVDLEGIDLHDLGERFTLAVAELEGVHTVGGLEGVVVGHVLSADPIEGTKLRLCQVDAGEGSPRQVVCGAPNVAAGQRVALARPGARFGDLEVAEREVRGHLSRGMIASERELDLGEDQDGILVLDESLKAGLPVSEALECDDVLFEIDNKSLTHRPDLWGHRGIAREIAALIGRPLKPMALSVPSAEGTPLKVVVDDQEACPRYTAVTLDGLTVGPSPLWLRLLLHRVGVRAINNVVDATNFTMLDLGNPLHAFDRREVRGDAITVRRATTGEIFTTLDGMERTLTDRDLLITDGEQPVALAGIMGGQNSEIRPDTRAMVLEVANFDAATVRVTSQRLGLRTDSSARFEKSLDPHLVADASRLCCDLLCELIPEARVTSSLMDVAAPLPSEPVISLDVDNVGNRLGVSLGEERITQILTGLSFGVTSSGSGRLEVTVPTFRATRDIQIQEDLIEEVGRIYGYDNIPPAPPTVSLSRPHANTQKRFERAARAFMTAGAGLDEVMTYSFAFDPLLDRMGARPEARLEVRNPISGEMPGLRTHLAPNLLGVLERNAHEEDRLSVFEIGRVYGVDRTEEGLPEQPTTLGALVATRAGQEGPELFMQLKGILGGLARAVGRPMPQLIQGGANLPWAHPVRQAVLACDGETLGALYEVHPLTLHQLDVPHGAAILELNLDAWRGAEGTPVTYSPIPRYPAVYRDFAVVVAEEVSATNVEDAIRSAAPDRVEAVTFQSLFRGGGVPESHKSMAWAVTLRWDGGTLTEPQVKELEEAIWASLASRVRGTPRA